MTFACCPDTQHSVMLSLSIRTGNLTRGVARRQELDGWSQLPQDLAAAMVLQLPGARRDAGCPAGMKLQVQLPRLHSLATLLPISAAGCIPVTSTYACAGESFISQALEPALQIRAHTYQGAGLTATYQPPLAAASYCDNSDMLNFPPCRPGLKPLLASGVALLMLPLLSTGPGERAICPGGVHSPG